MRAFVALEVTSPAVLDALSAFQSRLVSVGKDLKPVERENTHFTVKFLGEISEAQVEDAKAAIRSLRLSGGDVRVQGVGAFPSPGRPSVIWAGTAPEDASVVMGVAVPVIKALNSIGEKDDRPFRPHVTIARVRSRSPTPGLTALLRDSAVTAFGSTPIREVSLKSSLLTSSGPVYSDLEVFPLV